VGVYCRVCWLVDLYSKSSEKGGVRAIRPALRGGRRHEL